MRTAHVHLRLLREEGPQTVHVDGVARRVAPRWDDHESGAECAAVLGTHTKQMFSHVARARAPVRLGAIGLPRRVVMLGLVMSIQGLVASPPRHPTPTTHNILPFHLGACNNTMATTILTAFTRLPLLLFLPRPWGTPR